jgi:hypothetical protein
MDMREIRFDDLSKIEYHMFLYELPKEQGSFAGDQFLIIKFAGRHGIGSEGNNDSLFMEAVINTAIQVWFVEGLVLDFSGLSYEWGDSIGKVLLAGKKLMGSNFPTAVVVSELCRKALETASPFYAGQAGSGGQSRWLFNDTESALSYIKELKEFLKSKQEKKPSRKFFRGR